VLAVAALVSGTVLVVTASAAPASATGSRSVTGPYPAMAAELLDRVNGLRAKLGLGRLVDDPNVAAIALGWSTAMATDAQLAHNPNLAAEAPPGWERMGENVGVGENIRQLFNAFVASPTHYKNLVDPDFTRSGIAVMIDGNGELWVTQNFEVAVGDHRPAAVAASRSQPPAAPTAPAVAPADPPLPPPRLPDRMCFALEQLSGQGLQ